LTSLYLDSSALLKRYLEEEFSQQCEEIIVKYQDKYISQIGVTETLINLRKRLSASEFAMATKLFEADIAIFNIIEFDEATSYLAVEISEGTNLATLDAIHLASAASLGSKTIDFLTYDKVQRKAAKSLGFKTPGS
jgi:predicted nucleic acid-binding protein